MTAQSNESMLTLTRQINGVVAHCHTGMTDIVRQLVT